MSTVLYTQIYFAMEMFSTMRSTHQFLPNPNYMHSSGVRLWSCFLPGKQEGHFKIDYLKLKAYWTKKIEESLPLLKDQRNLGNYIRVWLVAQSSSCIWKPANGQRPPTLLLIGIKPESSSLENVSMSVNKDHDLCNRSNWSWTIALQ